MPPNPNISSKARVRIGGRVGRNKITPGMVRCSFTARNGHVSPQAPVVPGETQHACWVAEHSTPSYWLWSASGAKPYSEQRAGNPDISFRASRMKAQEFFPSASEGTVPKEACAGGGAVTISEDTSGSTLHPQHHSTKVGPNPRAREAALRPTKMYV